MDDVDNWFSARDSNKHRQNALGRCYKALVKETGVGWSRQGMEKQKWHGKAEMQWVPGGKNGQHNFAGMDDIDNRFSARDSNEHQQNALGWLRYNSVAARKRFVKETGVRWSWQGMEKQKCNGMFCIEVSREKVTEGGVVVVLAGGAEAPVGAGSSVSIASSAVLTRFVVTETIKSFLTLEGGKRV
ncbi:hypothetical protein RhiirA4_458240 [Rhizophagus irregularis]|uniref:Uncharacterized protein n=1 Tax=Rhizophagus irregularis TaxID=588596 RepID=A0A2I1GBQ8_9GLOM|nr:hypothetical protein RhiirA4_458240 [Rhizophagus irregularis]